MPGHGKRTAMVAPIQQPLSSPSGPRLRSGGQAERQGRHVAVGRSPRGSARTARCVSASRTAGHGDRARLPMVRLPGRPRHVGVCLRIQYGRAAMRVNRQQQGTRIFLALAVVLVSLWTGGLAAPSAGNLADFLATSRSQPGIQPAALRDGAQPLRPAGERPGPRGRLLPLLAILAAAVAGGCWRWAGQRNGLARAGSHACATPLQARAPPHLQPA